MTRVVIWLDDLRDPAACTGLIDAHMPPRDEVVWCRNASAFKVAFETVLAGGELVGICFDNDLGTKVEGRDVFRWVERQVRKRNLPRFALYAQTANLPARRSMNSGFKALKRFWREQ